MNTDYPIEALTFLLDEECLLARYAPLVPLKETLLSGLRARGCAVRSDAAALPDDALIELGLPEPMIPLFRRFLALYEVKPQKLREIGKTAADEETRAVYGELYCLPGVKATRADLYRRAGYASLASIARAEEEELLRQTADVIRTQSLDCAVPLPKEVRTHIAVAKAFTLRDEGQTR